MLLLNAALARRLNQLSYISGARHLIRKIGNFGELLLLVKVANLQVRGELPLSVRVANLQVRGRVLTVMFLVANNLKPNIKYSPDDIFYGGIGNG